MTDEAGMLPVEPLRGSQLTAAQNSTTDESKARPGPQAFDEFRISREVHDAIAEMGYVKPTDVQSAVIEPAMAGHDLVVQARTGSGKTSAFGVPIVERLRAGVASPGLPQALVLTPTRELAVQVGEELRKLGGKKGLKTLAIYGGMPMGPQRSALDQGLDIVVGTPGRLLDHIRRRNLGLSEIKHFVLDEADEMLSMGFWDEVTELLGMAPTSRQTMLFSATLPYDVARASAQYLREPVRLDLSGDDLTVEGIDNAIYHLVADIPKPRQLLYVLEEERPTAAIVFCNTRYETEMIAKYLTQSGFIAEAISGSFRQAERERVMERTKQGELRFMVATDIAARGIDINDLSHVFNYSLPEFSEVYLHRVGRTGRIGKVGCAVSLVDGPGLATLSLLERQFGIHFVEKTLPSEAEVSRRRSERIMKELLERASVAEVSQHMPVAQEILGKSEAVQVIAFLLKSYFNTQAAEAERHSRTAPSQPQPQPQHQHQSQHSESAPSGEASAEGSRRRRRRRRRRGGRGGERGPMSEYGEVIDMREALAENSDAPPPPEAAPASAPAGEAVSEEPATPAVIAAPGGNGSQAPAVAAAPSGMTRLRVNIGFDDGFKGRGAVAKKIAS
ncbi:MAG: DEAD/DEAH box helicase, partial [Deltaproteobacteria bacterium]|nr:DEAD/DEAH box helicase [Deltaproteobacteria bacterium]